MLTGAVVLALLAACSDDSGSDLPEADATPSASATQEWEWSATEPPPEPAEQELSSDSAQEYLQFVLTTIFYSYATGDADPVVQQEDAETDACEGCTALRRFADAPDKKLQVAGSEPTFTVTDERINDEIYYNYSVSMDIPAGERIAGDDEQDVEELPASSDVPASVNLRWVDDGWTLLNFSLGD